MNHVHLQTEDDAKSLRYDPHGLLPTPDELAAAAHTSRRRRSLLQFHVRVNLDALEPPIHHPSLVTTLVRLTVTPKKLHNLAHAEVRN